VSGFSALRCGERIRQAETGLRRRDTFWGGTADHRVPLRSRAITSAAGSSASETPVCPSDRGFFYGDGSGCYPVIDAIKGSVDCAHQSRRPLLSSQAHLSLQAPLRSRHATLRHHRLTRTRRDRSRYPGQISRPK